MLPESIFKVSVESSVSFPFPGELFRPWIVYKVCYETKPFQPRRRYLENLPGKKRGFW